MTGEERELAERMGDLYAETFEACPDHSVVECRYVAALAVYRAAHAELLNPFEDALRSIESWLTMACEPGVSNGAKTAAVSQSLVIARAVLKKARASRGEG
jgi:hypothetical protein